MFNSIRVDADTLHSMKSSAVYRYIKARFDLAVRGSGDPFNRVSAVWHKFYARQTVRDINRLWPDERRARYRNGDDEDTRVNRRHAWSMWTERVAAERVKRYGRE